MPSDMGGFPNMKPVSDAMVAAGCKVMEQQGMTANEDLVRKILEAALKVTS